MGRNSGKQTDCARKDDWITHDQSLDVKEGAPVCLVSRPDANLGGLELVAGTEHVLAALMVVVRQPIAVRIHVLILELVGEVERLEREIEALASPTTSTDASTSAFPPCLPRRCCYVPARSSGTRPGTQPTRGH